MKPLLIFRVLVMLAMGATVSAPARGRAEEQVTEPAGPALAPTAPFPAPGPSPVEPVSAAAAPVQTESAAPVAPIAPVIGAALAAPVARPAPAARVAPSSGPSDLVRRRCKIAGAVLLGLAGATVVAFFGTLIYNAVASPDALSIAAGPRLGFSLSAVALGISGSALLGYSLNAPGRPAPAPPARPTATRDRVLIPESGSASVLELQF